MLTIHQKSKLGFWLFRKMKSSKVSLPSNFILNFYHYFSYFSLFATWLVSPLLFYVIFTQSRQLGSLRWFILYSATWCWIFETVLSFNQFIILTPSTSVYSIGVIANHGSFDKTFFANIIAVACIVNYSIALALALSSRYLFVFPSALTGWINLKIMLGIAFTFILGLIVLLAYATITKSDPAVAYAEAATYDEFFLVFQDPSLLYFSYDFGKPVGIVFFTTLNCLAIFAIACVVHFIQLVKSTKTGTVSKIQYSLIISCIVEVLLMCIVLILPAIIFVGFVVFQIPNSAAATAICISFIHLYCPINFFTTLYFVAPYRRYLSKQLSQMKITKFYVMKSVTIPPAESVFIGNHASKV